MFSWKNIKDTYAEKVKNSESTADKTLGVLEVVGKSLASGVTVVVKEIPSIIVSIAEDAIDETKQKANIALNKSTTSDEVREKAQDFLDEYGNKKQQISESKEKLKGFVYFDQENIREREKKRFTQKVAQLQKDIVAIDGHVEKLRLQKDQKSSELTGCLEDELQQKLLESIEQLSSAIIEMETKIENKKTDIENYSKRLEGY